MKLDFWNNPLVVSSFRTKYRRGSPALLAALYVMALIGVGALFQINAPPNWLRIYLVALLGIQSFLSVIMSITATHMSLNEEVVNQTLDFQRIVSLSPRQILIGKLLGEPALAYVLAMASLPLAVFCVVGGAANILVVLLIYLSLFTTIFLFGSLGLIHSLQPSTKKSGGGNAFGLVFFAIFIVPQIVIGGVNAAMNPVAAPLMGLTSPIVSIIDVYRGSLGSQPLSIYGLKIPFLFVTPFSQLLIAGLVLEGMARRLVDPMRPMLSKPMAYGFLFTIDVLTACILASETGAISWTNEAIGLFCVIHFFACGIALLASTPGRDPLVSRVWRTHGKQMSLGELCCSDRSPNTAALVVMCLIGAIGLFGFLLGGGAIFGFCSFDAVSIRSAAGALALVSGVIFALGALYQAILLIGSRGGIVAFFLLMMLLFIGPFAAGEALEIPLLRDLSPIPQLLAWFEVSDPLSGKLPPPSPIPLLFVYGPIALLSLLWLRGWLAFNDRVVERKLQSMGVEPAPQPAG